MSYERVAIFFKSLSLVLSLGLVIGCSAGDPSSSGSTEDAVGQSEADLVARRLCAGPQGFQCSANQYCAAVKVGQCPDKSTYGVCTARPNICPKIFMPVCGCDGVTYSNSCVAAAAGAAVAKTGACDPKPTFCGGIAGIPCPDGEQCVDDPNDNCNPKAGDADCGGICVSGPDPAFCGGIAGIPCPKGQTCIDDPKDDCDPKNGGADCSGICVSEPEPAFCGGIAGIPCPEGQTCIDDPKDDCDPKNGGADCSGICVTKTNPCAVVLCKVGTQCVDKGGVAVCVPVPTDPCATVRCMAGTQCVNQGGVAVCLPTEPCGKTTCSPGLVCCNPLLSICTKPGGVCIF